MKRILTLILLSLFAWLLPTTMFGADPPTDASCLSAQEQELVELINAIRAEYGKPPVPLSASLTVVAKQHVADLNANPPGYKAVCNLHSWSDDGPWTPCCYTSDHAQRDCMFKKPAELTDYKYDGYEIAYYLESGATPQKAVKGWKKSQSHYQLMCSQGPWGMMNLEAMGVAINGQYAVAWFGRMPDPTGPPQGCK